MAIKQFKAPAEQNEENFEPAESNLPCWTMRILKLEIQLILYLHCVVCSKGRTHCTRGRHFGYVAITLWLLFRSSRSSFQPDVRQTAKQVQPPV